MVVHVEVGTRFAAATLCAVPATGCGAKGNDDSGDPATNPMAGSSATAGMTGSTDGSGNPGNMPAAGSSGSGGLGSVIAGKPSSTPDGNTTDDLVPDDITPPPPEVVEMLDPSVDWKALTIIFPTMYSAFDGQHTFQVPAHVDGATIALSAWKAIPADSVSFDPDPDVEGGVLITVMKGEPQITIAANDGAIGGTAALFITTGTPQQWEAGRMRYSNGVDFELPGFEDVDFSKVLDPNWTPPPPPGDLACNNCHTTGAKYFEIQHSPTQAARFSDDDLKKILTMGTKPEGVGFRLLPAMLGSLTDKELYMQFHKWQASDEELKGLIMYMRSLTPTGQGDIRLPDGTYVEPGQMPNIPPRP